MRINPNFWYIVERNDFSWTMLKGTRPYETKEQAVAVALNMKLSEKITWVRSGSDMLMLGIDDQFELG